MSVQFKFKDDVGENRRREIIKALGRAGFAARSLFPGQTRAKLASIFTVSEAEVADVRAVQQALTGFDRDIEYVEAAPSRGLKG
jgi:hypothetical protein